MSQIEGRLSRLWVLGAAIMVYGTVVQGGLRPLFVVIETRRIKFAHNSVLHDPFRHLNSSKHKADPLCQKANCFCVRLDSLNARPRPGR